MKENMPAGVHNSAMALGGGGNYHSTANMGSYSDVHVDVAL